MCLSWCAPALAVSTEVQSIAGVMQQPSSHYYHAIVGAAVKHAFTPRFEVQATYWQRPKNSGNGYEDQDRGLTAGIATKLNSSKRYSLLSGIGAGAISGYIKKTDSGETRNYRISGLSLDLSAKLHLDNVSIGVMHQAFTGFGSQLETKAFVGWPFSVFAATVGISL
jgi:hypothetical protein